MQQDRILLTILFISLQATSSCMEEKSSSSGNMGNPLLTTIETQATKLYNACKNGQNEKVENLLQQNPILINVVDKYNQSLLFWPAHNNDTKIIETLIKHKININHQDELGRTALHMTAIKDACEAAKLLLENRAKTDIETNDGATALHAAVSASSQKVAKILNNI